MSTRRCYTSRFLSSQSPVLTVAFSTTAHEVCGCLSDQGDVVAYTKV
jgi:hypothetical protein